MPGYIKGAHYPPLVPTGTKAYFGGGYTGAWVNTVDKFTIATETCGIQSSAALSKISYGDGTLSAGPSKSYFLGGTSGGGNDFFATTDMITFSNDTKSAAGSASLSLSRSNAGCVSTSLDKGYVQGGSTFAGRVVTADKTTYSTDTTAAQASANLSSSDAYCSGVSNRDVKGYCIGYFNVSNKLVFATDTSSYSANTVLPNVNLQAAGVSEVLTKGYIAGGRSTSVLATNKITFSTDVASSVTAANLPHASDSLASASGGPNYGYFAGGKSSGSYISAIDRITYATETCATIAAVLSTGRDGPRGVSDLTF